MLSIMLCVAGPVPYFCTFESENLCDMVQLTSDNFDWTWQRRDTPTGGSGPDNAAQGEYYIYTEVSAPRVQGDRAAWVYLLTETYTSLFCTCW